MSIEYSTPQIPAAAGPGHRVQLAGGYDMTDETLMTMGQQFGRRSWAEPWKIKMVEPIHMIDREERARCIRAPVSPAHWE